MNTKTCRGRCKTLLSIALTFHLKGESHRPATRILSLILSFAMLFTLITGLDISAFAENNNSKNVYLGDNKLLVNDDNDVICKFAPKQSGAYKFKVYDGYIMSFEDSEMSFGYNYFHNNTSDDSEIYYLNSGTTYLIKCSGKTLSVSKLMNVKSISVLNAEVNGFFDCQLYPFRNLQIKVLLENDEEKIINLKDLNCHYDSSNVYFYNDDFEFECRGLMRKNTDNVININCNTVKTSFNVTVDKYVTKAILQKNAENEYFKNGEVMLYFSDGTSMLFKNDAGKVNFGGWGGVDEYLVSYGLLLRSNTGIEFYSDCVHNFYDKNSEPLTFLPSNNINNRIYIGQDWKVYFDFKTLIQFDDLSNFDFYSSYVVYTSVNNSFLKGTNPPYFTEFSPTTAITRAMFVTILYRMAGEPYANNNPYSSSPFTDITDTDAYYYDAACWALDEGITTETTFKPFNNVTREQTATFLYRYAQDNDKLGDTDYKNVNLNAYHDGNSISHFAVDAMRWANYNGMITGTQQGYANPQGATQRIHATKILYGFGKVCNIGNFA